MIIWRNQSKETRREELWFHLHCPIIITRFRKADGAKARLEELVALKDIHEGNVSKGVFKLLNKEQLLS
jgi:hypothetical protein